MSFGRQRGWSWDGLPCFAAKAWTGPLQAGASTPSSGTRTSRAGSQILGNLLSNALKFTPPGGSIVVGLQRTTSEVTVAVSDTGAGIEPTFLPVVFDRFRQGRHAGRGRGRGLGLGLAVARQLVELHGGLIEADSPGPGRGSTFTVRLPVEPTRGRQPVAQPSSTSQVVLEEVTLEVTGDRSSRTAAPAADYTWPPRRL
jgi:hypothetical protein